MPPLYMDTRSEFDCTGSVSGDDTSSSDRGELESCPRGEKRGRRQEKNKVAARKSRMKQTHRADELHEEFQSLERSNTALEKEIAALKKEFQHYTAAMERHKPSCRLHASSSRPPVSASPTPAVAPLCATLLNGSSPSSSSSTGTQSPLSASVSTAPAAIFSHTGEAASTSALSPSVTQCQVSYSGFTATPSVPGLHALDKPASSSHLAWFLSSPIPTTFAHSSASHCAPSGLPTHPGPPGLTSARPTNVPLTTVLAGTASDLPPVTSLTSALSRSEGTFRLSSSDKPTNVLLPQTDTDVLLASAQTVFPPPYPGLVNVQSLPSSNHLNARANLAHAGAFLVLPTAPRSESLAVRGLTNAHQQLHSGQSSVFLTEFSPSQALQPLSSQSSVAPQTNPGTSPALDFASSSSGGQHNNSTTSAPLLSLLTVPSPIRLSFSHSLPNLSTAPDPSYEPSLTDLLELNPWLLDLTAGWDS